MTKIKIKVTKDILNKSRFCTQKVSTCAFALAVRDLFPYAWITCSSVIPDFREMKYAFPGQMIINTDEIMGKRLSFSISKDMENFIRRFDNSSPEQIMNFSEQEFELDIPDWALGLVDISDIKEHLKQSELLSVVG